MKLKVEVNTREHFALMGYRDERFRVDSRWFTGEAAVKTFALEELLATKLRALYQRKKGRDLLDLWLGLTQFKLDREKLVANFQEYLQREGLSVNRSEFLENLAEKMQDQNFKTDTRVLLASGFKWNMESARQLLESEVIALLPIK